MTFEYILFVRSYLKHFIFLIFSMNTSHAVLEKCLLSILFHHVSNISHTLNRKNKEYFHLINLESRCPQPPVPFHFAPSIMNRITFLFPPRLSSHLDDKRQTAAYYIAAYSLSHIDYLSSAEKVTFVIILSYFPNFYIRFFKSIQ